MSTLYFPTRFPSFADVKCPIHWLRRMSTVNINKMPHIKRSLWCIIKNAKSYTRIIRLIEHGEPWCNPLRPNCSLVKSNRYYFKHNQIYSTTISYNMKYPHEANDTPTADLRTRTITNNLPFTKYIVQNDWPANTRFSKHTERPGLIQLTIFSEITYES